MPGIVVGWTVRTILAVPLAGRCARLRIIMFR